MESSKLTPSMSRHRCWLWLIKKRHQYLFTLWRKSKVMERTFISRTTKYSSSPYFGFIEYRTCWKLKSCALFPQIRNISKTRNLYELVKTSPLHIFWRNFQNWREKTFFIGIMKLANDASTNYAPQTDWSGNKMLTNRTIYVERRIENRTQLHYQRQM